MIRRLFRPPKRKSKRRKIYSIILIVFIFISCFYGRFDIVNGFEFNSNIAYADSSEQTAELEQQLQEEIDNQIGNLDFSAIEDIITKLSTDAKNLFSADSFVEKVNYVISGEYAENSESFFSSVLSIFWQGLKDFLPIIASIISISILGGMVANLKPATNGKSVGNIIHFVTYGIVIIFLGVSLVEIIKITTSTLTTINFDRCWRDCFGWNLSTSDCVIEQHFYFIYNLYSFANFYIFNGVFNCWESVKQHKTR